MTHLKSLGIAERTFLPHLVAAASDLYGRQRADLDAAQARLMDYVDVESERFERTLSAGYRRLERFLKQRDNGTISGEQALDLVKHHGVPLLLLEIELDRRELPLNKQSYERAYRRWRQVEVGAR